MNLEDQYPINTFVGETQKELIEFIEKYAQEYAEKIISNSQTIIITRKNVFIDGIKAHFDYFRNEQRKLNNERGGKL